MFEFYEKFLYKDIEINNQGDYIELFIENNKCIVLYKNINFVVSEENFNELLKNTSFHKGVSAGFYIALHSYDNSILFVSVKDKRYSDALSKNLISKKEIKIGDLVECYNDYKGSFIYLGDIFVIEKYSSDIYYKKGYLIGEIEKNNTHINIRPIFIKFPQIKRVIEHINEFSSLKNNFDKFKLSLKPFEKVNDEYNFYVIDKIGKYVADIYISKKEEQKELTQEFNNLLKDSLCEKLKKEDITLTNLKKCIAVMALNQKDVLAFMSIHTKVEIVNYKYKNEIFKIYFYN